MSDLQRSFAKAHLAKLPPEPPPIFDEREEEEEEEDIDDLPQRLSGDSSSSASSTGTIKPSPTKQLFERSKETNGSRSRSGPLPWNDFFSQELFLERQVEDLHITHHAYLTPPTSSGPLFVTHHGAGSSGLSFAVFASELLKLLPTAGILSLDARGHGSTTTTTTSSPSSSDAPIDLSLPTLASDLVSTIHLTRTHLPWPTLPNILLIGHSLGGAVVTHAAHSNLLGPSLLGYCVLDVVEGSALDALANMSTYLSTRPTTFPSLASAIEWHLRSRTLRNTLSARVSVPPLLKPTSPSSTQYTWTTDLTTTQPFWPSWFTNLSSKFLSARGGKLLLLAGTDRLDKELMIGQMQGKYQLAVFPEAGHFVHEDQPAKTAGVVADFYRRNDQSKLVLPMKVGEMLRTGKGGKGFLK